MTKKENYLATIPQIIKDAKAGKMFILVDDENRENEGDLVIPAQFCNDAAVNFMSKYGRGLICLALNEKRVEELELPLMSMNNNSRHKTAFTVSIEAREGISTGISAFDRAKTIADAINPKKGRFDLVSPGHIFPLRARDGGVLVRAGHTEASVDIAKMAGLNESGVICEIMNEDGSMARLPDLIKFAKKHQLKIATIADLIEYRRKNEKLITKVLEQDFESKIAGKFKMKIYRSLIDNVEHVVLQKGKIDSKKPTLVRMHHLNILSDCLDNASENKSNLIEKSLKKIAENKSGVLVLIRNLQERISDLLDAEKSKESTIRNYGIGAQILVDLGIKEISLISSSKKTVVGLDAYGLEIVSYCKL